MGFENILDIESKIWSRLYLIVMGGWQKKRSETKYQKLA